MRWSDFSILVVVIPLLLGGLTNFYSAKKAKEWSSSFLRMLRMPSSFTSSATDLKLIRSSGVFFITMAFLLTGRLDCYPLEYLRPIKNQQDKYSGGLSAIAQHFRAVAGYRDHPFYHPSQGEIATIVTKVGSRQLAAGRIRQLGE